ncbi:hypothetical protein, partial [Bordetella tumbae]|uniref:hypothetical protein n=1 Tax=Bordetella tumbae TaxID=1649139 RepID=UPI0039EEF39F
RFAHLVRAFALPSVSTRSATRRANTVTAPLRLAASLIPSPLARAVYVGFVGDDFCKNEDLAGRLFIGAYGRANE